VTRGRPCAEGPRHFELVQAAPHLHDIIPMFDACSIVQRVGALVVAV
jgi:hypothetical protein